MERERGGGERQRCCFEEESCTSEVAITHLAKMDLDGGEIKRRSR